MAEINILNSETIDKIAAGEVVERPASVVKELVENAIDAGAAAITVEVRDGGIEFIRVTDNGSGMEREQLRKAFLRHATSKIESADDLTHVASLGFRGEALSSIAAVSKTEVITKTRERLTGTRMLLEGGVELVFEDVGAPEGTTFIVRNLFYNTPVRRKFLKQPATEGGYISDLMEHMALSRPDISFKFILGSQNKFHTSGNGDLKEVIYRIYGREVAASLVPIQMTEDGITIEGYLGKPVLVRSNRNFEIYYINGRFIKSNVMAKAIEEGYKEYLMQHKFPLCVLHITMDAWMVDVNVHPTKMDVRFSDTIAFVRTLSHGVSQALKHREMIPEACLEEKKATRQAESSHAKLRIPEPFELKREESYRVMEETKYHADTTKMQDFVQNPVWNRVLSRDKIEKIVDSASETGKKQLEADFFFEEIEQENRIDNPPEESIHGVAEAGNLSEECAHGLKETGSLLGQDNGSSQEASLQEIPMQEASAQKAPTQMSLFEEKIISVENRSRYRIIGQAFETYWLIQFEDKLLIMDQHAAHEKVKYERLMKQYREKHVLSQGLMPPVIISLTGQEEAALRENEETFLALGFEVEAFGGNEYALRSVPVDLYGCSEREMFLEALDALSEGRGAGGIRAVEEKIASMSCKAAVKGNNLLRTAEAQALIDELLTLENPYNCPHGRPTIITMSKQEMEKKFKRIL